ncbi:MAG: sulfotransferase domain-containing protein [Sphingorhabdus sp.]
MTESYLPQFIIIGAVKAATTWVLEQLQANPAIFMPGPEPHYFSSEFHRGPDYYTSFFEGKAAPGQMLGEKSADYLAHPLAAERMAKMLPQVRLAAQLRNPVERAYSDYKMLYRRGTIKGQPEDYLLSLDNPQPRFLLDGLYADHLSRWFEHFPQDRFNIFLFEDVRARPREVVEQLTLHIGATPFYDEVTARRRANDSSEHFLPLPVRTALAPLKKSVAPLRGTKWFEGVRSLMTKQIDYPPLSADVSARLRDFYAKDVERLGQMIGRDLSHWVTEKKPVMVESVGAA